MTHVCHASLLACVLFSVPAVAAPTITSQPTAVTVEIDKPASFSVTASGLGTLKYQWRKDGTNIRGATATTYSIPKVSTLNRGTYSVVVSTTLGGSVTSQGAPLTVLTPPPAIIRQPISVSAPVGGSVTFSVEATGPGQLRYQWRKGGVSITGATASSYTLSNITTLSAGDYSVVVSNTYGSVTSQNASLKVGPPAITTQPRSAQVCAGSSVSFSVDATGALPLQYQWRKNGVAIANATASTYTISAADTSFTGSNFTVVVTNAYGTATTTSALLTVLAPPSITAAPVPKTAITGETATFSATAAGSTPLYFQWQKNGIALLGATSSNYTTPTLRTGDAAAYSVVVSNSCGATKSAEVSLSIQCSDLALANLRAKMAGVLDDPNLTLADFTVLLRTEDGRTFERNHGTSTPDTAYESASTSKWITAVVILDLIDQGVLSLDDKMKDILPTLPWFKDLRGTAAQTTLRHLLNFTSGFSQEPACIHDRNASMEQCATEIFNANIPAFYQFDPNVPGETFYYSASHMQLAGMMAVRALQVSSWQDVFARFKSRHPGLLASSTYELPSVNNPRLAGGMTWTANDYIDLLDALHRGALLTESTRAELFSNQIEAAQIGYSPVAAGMAQIGRSEDWRYALGNWVECKNADFSACTPGLSQSSSPGAFGAYPFIDFENQYVGILATQQAIGSFPEGVDLFRRIEGWADQWASKDCGYLPE